MSFAKVACVVVLLASAGSASATLEQRQTTLVQRFPVAAAQVSEAPEGHSDNNWVVQNIVDGRWGTPPFYPNQQWMARHIGELGFDIWCRLDFGQPRDVCMIRLQNSQLGSFVCLKDLSLEFEGGVRVPITLEHNRVPQTFRFPVARSSFVIVHLLNHYGDGLGIDINSGGLAEVEVFGLGRGVAQRTNTPSFTVAKRGGITTWLLAAGATQAETRGRVARRVGSVGRSEGPLLGDGDQPDRRGAYAGGAARPGLLQPAVVDAAQVPAAA